MRHTHLRTWRVHALYSGAILFAIYPFTFILLHLFSYETAPVVICAFILLGNTAIFGHQLYTAVARRRDFVCRIDDSRLLCICPEPSGGDSFDIAIADIDVIEVDDGVVTIRLQDGSKHWLTSNYGNPANEFITSILDSNPTTKLVHSSVSQPPDS